MLRRKLFVIEKNFNTSHLNIHFYYQKAKEIVTNLSEKSDPLQTARLYFKVRESAVVVWDRS